ncbi:lipopolysaccharide ABC transporter permease LptG [Alginatibacterium sediminis]|uniref:Lipopolysaccharide ABC transporter permease LptG n=1 Tax=Alginatibacterium sediminis TaxID=2164068 RepID=A0A420EDB1_9ALTE|nr:LPS export ABC transporter permease LptG [Alginatibacterium sediminis]RKF18656.1 lipopolysaccharide ABC transporter permease LptG [Alginatibacterium sediminis]
MFKIIDWYVGRTIFLTTMLVLITLQSLALIIKFVEQLRAVGRGNYEILDALWYSLLSVPKELELFFPMAALLGSLIGLGSLASSSELIVMQAAGLSRWNISWAVLKTAVPMIIATMLLGEFIAPTTEIMADEMRSSKISGGSIMTVERGLWAKDGDGFVNIGEARDGDKLFNVTIFRFKEQQHLYQQIEAKTAVYQENNWLLKDSRITEYSDDKIERRHLSQMTWESSLNPEKLSVVSIKPLNLSLSGLYAYIQYLHENQQDASQYELSLARKLMSPVITAVMMLLALSFVFGPLRSVSMGVRLMMGVVAGFSYYILDQVLGALSLVYGLPPLASASVPSLLFLSLAIVLLRRRT